MKFAAALLFAAGAIATNSFEPSFTTDVEEPNVTYTTEVVTAITTYCPEPTEITMGETTYTVTEATTLTISDCPCTIKVPITTVSSVICETCDSPSSIPPIDLPSPTSVGTIGTVTRPAPTFATSSPPIVTGGAGKAAALSGGAIVLGVAALVL